MFVENAIFIQRVIPGFEHEYIMSLSFVRFNEIFEIAKRINKENKPEKT